MYEQILEDTLFIILYTVVTVISAIACIYLLFRRGNAFAAHITTPRRLRRWTAAFFGVIAIGHLWYIPSIMPDSVDSFKMSLLIGGLLDCLLTIPMAFIVMLCMLQDRQRPLWPVAVMIAPLVVGMAVCLFTLSDILLPIVRIYFVLMSIAFIIYMIHALKQYGRWLRENYADLEHKEVWQSIFALAYIMLMFGYYVSGASGMTYEYIIQTSAIVLIGYLLWRVETLQTLETHHRPLSVSEGSGQTQEQASELSTSLREGTDESLPEESQESLSLDALLSARNDIGPLLKQYCEETQLYLKHDISLNELATMIGTNRTYLSSYFSLQGITYNTYINALRIQHFVTLCHKKAAANEPITLRELVHDSGFRSYNTFNTAFKQNMGTTVTVWLNKLNFRY